MILDRDATVEKLVGLAAEAAGEGATLLVFPEAFIPVYPSSSWAKAFAGWADDRAKQAFALLADQAVSVPGQAADRIGEAAREHGVWIVTGVTEVDPERPGTLYNTLLYHAPSGELALRHRKLVPTNHERLVWGQGDGGGLRAIQTEVGRIGGLICWENYMPLARLCALRVRGRGLYRVDGRRLGAVAVNARAHRTRVAGVRRGAVALPAGEFLSGRLSATGRARGARRGRSWRERDPRSGRLLPGRAAVRRGRCSTRSSIRPCCVPSASVSTRPGTTTGLTSSG